jgi:hypothetical protein
MENRLEETVRELQRWVSENMYTENDKYIDEERAKLEPGLEGLKAFQERFNAFIQAWKQAQR